MIATMMAMALIGVTQDADPLAPARAGKLQCYTPDVAEKTCGAIAAYARQADGSYLNTANVLVSPDQGIALEAASVVWVKNGAVCGILSRTDTMAGTVTINGASLSIAMAQSILEQINTGYAEAGMLDREICTAYVPDGDRLRAEITVDGVARPEFSQPVIWIRPEDGYQLGA